MRLWVLYSLNYELVKDSEITLFQDPCLVKLFTTKEQAELCRTKLFEKLKFPLVVYDKDWGDPEYYHEDQVCWIVEQDIEDDDDSP